MGAPWFCVQKIPTRSSAVPIWAATARRRRKQVDGHMPQTSATAIAARPAALSATTARTSISSASGLSVCQLFHRLARPKPTFTSFPDIAFSYY